jgi:hypothetical protein
MRLVLHYRGPLKSNGSPAHKHELRRHFHAQLKRLWSQKPLSEMTAWLQPDHDPNEYHFLRPKGSFVFAPLITADAETVAELNIVLLRPEPPGGLITQGGDIDNRLKSLFDALSMPPHASSLPPGAVPAVDEQPLYCLLEDDNLVISVAVRTEQLLEPGSDPSIVDATIAVETHVTRRTYDNGIFG